MRGNESAESGQGNMSEPSKLIDSLVKDLKPVPDRSRLLTPAAMVALLLTGLVLVSLVLAGVMGEAGSWSGRIRDPAFYLALLPALPAVLWALCLSLPGRRTGHWAAMTGVLFLVWGAYLVFDVWRSGGAASVVPSRFCILDILVMAFAPLFVLLSIVRRRFLIGADAAVVALFLASSLAGAACAGIVCVDHSAIHVLQEHFMPVLVLLIVIVVSRLVWRRQTLY